MVHLLCALVLIIGLLELTHSSPGDRDFAYQNCVRICVKTCSYKRLDAFLRLLQWECQSDCRYNCMMEITRKREVNKQPILQYHGKVSSNFFNIAKLLYVDIVKGKFLCFNTIKPDFIII